MRFEIPARYRHFREVTVRYARWDLGRVDLVDRSSGTILAPIYPLDKSANADGRRAVVEPDGTRRAARGQSPRQDGELPPLLKKILQEYSATGMPPAYLPKTPPSQNGETHHEQQETARAVGAEMEPVFTRAPQRGTAGDPQDRALRLARRTAGPGGGLRADHG